jgi:hypothetical protein
MKDMKVYAVPDIPWQVQKRQAVAVWKANPRPDELSGLAKKRAHVSRHRGIGQLGKEGCLGSGVFRRSDWP